MYLALYREWRPRRFNDIAGQEHVTKTIMNAIKQQKVAHAYLFSGPRGTGKTTTAKILAKSLNCDQRPENEIEPCNECSSCLSIDQGAALEVFEIDAASNRGIDEIRDLREKVRLSASRGKYKVYIIDEVHMLTTEAFNALLKTLEEPPKQVVFILATTEVHKIPLTILSRVQRFEFHRISVENIQKRLTEVCDSLGRVIDYAALQVIAQKSEGGLRDALSILDQCLLLDDPLGVNEVYQVLGMVGETFSSEIVEGLLTSNYGDVLSHLTTAVNQGRDPRQILRELLDYLRQALLFLAAEKLPVVSPHIQEKLMEQSKKIGIRRLLRWIAILLQGEGQLKFATNARLAVELLLVQAIYESESSIDETLTSRLTDMELEIKKNLKIEGKESLKDKSNHQPLTQKKNINQNQNQSNSINLQQNEKGKNTENNSNLDGIQEISIEKIEEKWPVILDNVRKIKKSTHAFLLEGKPGKIEGNILTLVFRKGFSFHRDKVNQPENSNTIEQVLREALGVKLTLQNIMEDEETSLVPKEEGNEDIMIKKAKDLFGPSLVVVHEE